MSESITRRELFKNSALAAMTFVQTHNPQTGEDHNGTPIPNGATYQQPEASAIEEYYVSLPMEDKIDFTWGVIGTLIERQNKQDEEIAELKKLAAWALEKFLQEPPMPRKPSGNL